MNNMEHEDKREAVNRELQLRFKGYATNKTGTRVICRCYCVVHCDSLSIILCKTLVINIDRYIDALSFILC
jgi:hypothetical protein